MSDEEEYLSSSETYLKKTNRTILFVGLGALFAFLIGLVILMGGVETVKEDARLTVGDGVDASSGVTGTGVDQLQINMP